MTTIAWDGTNLAADSCSWSSGVRRRSRKVFRIHSPEHGGDLLVAFTGHVTFCLAVLRWLWGQDEKPDPKEWHDKDDLDRVCCVVVDRAKVVRTLSNSLHWETFEDERIFASGGGQEFAWGALEAGASAHRAVEIAMLRSNYAGFGVDMVSFPP